MDYKILHTYITYLCAKNVQVDVNTFLVTQVLVYNFNNLAHKTE